MMPMLSLLFIHVSTDGQYSCVHSSAITHNATMNSNVQVFTDMFSILLGMPLGVDMQLW